MTTSVEYAVMAGASYISTRPDVNKFAVPVGWVEILNKRENNPASGFEATSFTKGTELVISFAGTYDKPLNPFTNPDLQADLALAAGVLSDQLRQAADYYLAVKAIAPAGTIITFTGHSLGGGLASLMAVMFGESAVTFDQAPFLNSARTFVDTDLEGNQTSRSVAQSLRAYLTGRTSESMLAKLDAFIASNDPLRGNPNPADTLDGRRGSVSNINVQGEFLSSWFLVPTSNRIGSQSDIVNSNDGVGGIDLHSQALLTAFLQSKQTAAVMDGKMQSLSEVTFKLPELLKMIFDKNLFAYPTDNENQTNPNFLELIVNHEAGRNPRNSTVITPDAMVTRLTQDLWKIAQDGGLSLNESIGASLQTFSNWNNVSKTLIAFAMQKYYDEQAGRVGQGETLFKEVSGGIRFDTAAVVGEGVTITEAKGYAQYFKNYLDGTSWLSKDELDAVNGILPQLRDWYVQASMDGMTAADAQNRGAFMLGGNTSDTLTGGGASDLLLGNFGNDEIDGGDGDDELLGGFGDDTLTGGLGADLLIGGRGNDTYYAEEGDTIRDSDGKGTVYLNGKKLSFALKKQGDDFYLDSNGDTYRLTNGRLEINDPLVIEDFDNGELGIYLDEAEDPNNPNQGPRGPGYNPNNASLVRRWDPLVLDLDGNGRIDTVASTASGIYFDFNGDGVSERAGWIASQDGLLALDGNGNGVVDGLDELFGSNRIDGFAELAQHDTNADGQIDTQDSVFAQLKVWQDANQDGINQAAELKTLADLGIENIRLATTPTNQALGDNLLTATGSYTHNGQTQLAADIHLAVNFALTDANPNRPLGLPPSLDADIFDLPWLRGYGNVKGLPIAYQESPGLKQAAADLKAQGGLAALRGFDSFLAQWSGLAAAHQAKGVTRTYLSTEDKAWVLETLTGQDVNKSAIEAANFGTIAPGTNRQWNTTYIDGEWNAYVQRSALNFALQAETKDWLKGTGYSLNLDRYVVHDAKRLQQSLTDHLKILDGNEEAAFAAIAVSKLKQDGAHLDSQGIKQAIAGSDYATLIGQVLDAPGTSLYGQVNNGAFQIDTGRGVVAWGLGGDDVLYGGPGNDLLDGGAGNDTLYGYNPYSAGAGGDDTYVFGWGYGQDTIVDYGSGAGGDTVRMKAGVNPADVTVTRDQSSLYLSLGNGTDRLTLWNWFGEDTYKIEQVLFADDTRWGAADLMERIAPVPATEGNDTIYSSEDGEAIDGRGGNDSLYGFGGDDALSGGAGNDFLDGGVGNDTLDGGAGNDSLSGGAGNDTYVFGLGSGQDLINDYDATSGNVDTVRMAANVSPADVTVTRDVNNLYLSLNGGADRLTLQNQFHPYDGGAYKIERVMFADGATWNAADLIGRISVPAGTANGDGLYGREAADAIDGLDGNDTLYGFGGDDALSGGAGNDLLDGGIGDDTLDGGTGDDMLQGGLGDDIYLFGNGDGKDAIYDYGGTDTLRMKAEVRPENVTVTRDQSHLYLSLNQGSDKLTLQYWFSGDTYRTEKLLFDDGTVWDAAMLRAKANTPTANADFVEGSKGDDVIDGLGGDDRLFGGGGNDVLNGGAGDDYLQGNAGNDTYLFGNGSGKDTIYEYNGSADNFDTVKMAEGVRPSDVTVTSDSANTYLSLNGGADRLTLQYAQYDQAYQVQRIEFADGTVWDGGTFAPATATTSGNDVLVGTAGADTLDGQAGYDQLWGEGGDDTLAGGFGDDILHGGAGNDVLDGGAGNDSLQGDSGNDVYVFGIGAGQDVVIDYDTRAGNVDTVQLMSGVAAPDVDVLRDRNNLYLSLNGGADRLTLANWFVGDAYKIERVSFSDGTAWTTADLLAKVSATDGNNVLWGSDGEDGIDGLAGDDLLYGFEGDDTLIGGSGDDTLWGHEGNDTLAGGTGNDLLLGGDGNDTYLFGIGDGQDTIADYDSNANKQDVIQFKAGVTAAAVLVSRQADNLMLKIAGTQDQLMVQNYFVNEEGFRASGVESIRFVDGTSWGYTEIKAKTLVATEGDDWLITGSGNDSIAGASGNDHLEGRAGNDALDGGNGNDALYGGDGADTLDGGSGSDILDGGAGNDTYLFGIGDGQDTISAFDPNANTRDTIQFKAGVTAAAVWCSRQAGDLVLNIEGTSDRLTVQSYFVSDWSAQTNTQLIRFADGSSWSFDDVSRRVLVVNAGTTGNDNLAGTGTAERLEGLDGNDLIYGYGGDDFLSGGAGTDNLYGGDGNDTLFGGAGTDFLYGGAGNDTYLFGRGDGTDNVSNYDLALGRRDVLQFVGNVSASDVDVRKVYDSLILSIRGTGDSVSVQSYFWRDGAGGWGLDAIRFADGTAWDFAAMKALTLPVGTPGNDVLYGFYSDDSIDGGAGDDYIRGLDGNDYLEGGAGDDNLSGDDGVDVLHGGAGNDYLTGGAGGDNYLFDIGDGQDRVMEWNSIDGAVDMVKFGSGIRPVDLEVTRSQYDLVLKRVGSDDQLIVPWYFSGGDTVEKFEFADGTVWDYSEIKAGLPKPTEGNDTLYAFVGDGQVSGLGGDDTIFGSNGDDVIDGGAGDDTIIGSYGNDTYLFGYGAGYDHISWFGSQPGDVDAIVFGQGVRPDDVEMQRGVGEGGLLTIRLAGATDRLDARGFFGGYGGEYGGELRFGDGTVWSYADVLSRAKVQGTNDAEYLYGSSSGETLQGLGGDDVLYGFDGDDVLIAGDGNDTLSGGAGKDTLDGGAGNDTFVFENGGGQDTILSTDNASGKRDVLRFGASVSPYQVDAGVSGGDLVLTVQGTSDRVTVAGYFAGNSKGIDAIEFANGWWHNFSPLGVLSVGDQKATQDTVYRLELPVNTFVDIDEGDVLTLSATLADGSALPSWLTFDVGSGTFIGTPGVADIGNLPVRITAYDLAGYSTSTDFNLTVVPPPYVLINGSDRSDLLIGTSGNDRIDGKGGGDTMKGGRGDDIYFVEQTGDKVVELANEGNDTIYANIRYLLPSNVENLVLTGSVGLKGTGNELDNTLTGTSADDTLDGGLGADAMTGGIGNDAYYVDNPGDMVSEYVDEGVDDVFASIDYLLTDNVENLTLIGKSANTGTGNQLDNVIIGNGIANVLDGGSGADTMAGGAGNDTYIVDNASDVVVEGGGKGVDTVYASVSYALPDNVENLVLTGTGEINGIGNVRNNALTGNSNNNLLTGGAGNDVLDGGMGLDFLEGLAGNDTMTDTAGNGYFNGGAGSDKLGGGAAADLYIGGAGDDAIDTGDGRDLILFNRGDGYDKVVSGGGGKTVSLGGGIAYADLKFKKAGNDLVLSTGTSEGLEFKNWYAVGASQSVTDLQVMVEAMAGFDAKSTDPLLTKKVVDFDFKGLVGAFDTARAANSKLSSWALTSALAQFRLSSTDSEALGGDLAYQYGRNGTLAGIGLTVAQQVLGDVPFGSQAQALRPLAGLQDGAARLS